MCSSPRPLCLCGLWDTAKIAGPLSIEIHEYLCVCVCQECVAYEWDVSGCLNSARLQVRGGKKGAFIPSALPLSPTWKVKEHYYMVHLLLVQLLDTKCQMKSICVRCFGGEHHITYMVAAFFSFLGCQYKLACREVGEWAGKYSYGLRGE